MATEEELYILAISGLDQSEDRLKFLSYRVSVLCKEKEELEARVARLEKLVTMGAGILVVLPIVGSAMGILLAFGKQIFRPWMSP